MIIKLNYHNKFTKNIVYLIVVSCLFFILTFLVFSYVNICFGMAYEQNVARTGSGLITKVETNYPANMEIKPIQNNSANNYQMNNVQTNMVNMQGQSHMSQNNMASNYGNNPCAPSMQRDMLLDQVWSSMVPRKILYQDPATNPVRPNNYSTTNYNRRKNNYNSTKNGKNDKNNKPKALPENNANQNKTADNNDSRLRLESGTHVVIDPGAHIVVWAADKKQELKVEEKANTKENDVDLVEVLKKEPEIQK